MTRYLAKVATENASRYLQQLCKHWSHKFDVGFDPNHGRIAFDADTSLVLDAELAWLSLRLEGRDAERVSRLRGVVAEHLQRFGFREELAIDWHEDVELG